ncbi:MAG: sulfurtransferase TusA family protein [Promethearchaeia archaeon]
MSLEEEKAVIKTLDIRGKVCPMTFVYTKITLEELEKGDLLEVILDFPMAVENIPDSCRRQSLAELIKVEEIDGPKKTWKLLLKKI